MTTGRYLTACCFVAALYCISAKAAERQDEFQEKTFLKIDEDGFYTERKVVEEEKRLRVMNAPYGTVPEKVLATLYKQHPYRWLGIGNIPHLRAATIDELQAFWAKFYVPNNATLVIVGAVRNADAQRLAEKY